MHTAAQIENCLANRSVYGGPGARQLKIPIGMGLSSKVFIFSSFKSISASDGLEPNR